MANAGIERVYYGEFYRDEKSLEVARQAGIELVDLGDGRLRRRQLAGSEEPQALVEIGSSTRPRAERSGSRDPGRARVRGERSIASPTTVRLAPSIGV